MGGKLYSEILEIDRVDESLCRDFFSIYETYFENVSFPVFVDHIGHKDKVIVLRDKEEKLVRGFSTFKVLDQLIDGKKIYGIFSGDTIIHKDYWGEQELVRSFCYLSGQVASQMEVGEKLYWLLISKGYKTYRYLPVFTENYYPSYKSPWPEYEKKVMLSFYKELYPDEFDSNTGLLTFKNKIGNLRPGVGDADDIRVQDPDIAFFVNANPDHMTGTELCCLAELSELNMKSVAKIFFMRGERGK